MNHRQLPTDQSIMWCVNKALSKLFLMICQHGVHESEIPILVAGPLSQEFIETKKPRWTCGFPMARWNTKNHMLATLCPNFTSTSNWGVCVELIQDLLNSKPSYYLKIFDSEHTDNFQLPVEDLHKVLYLLKRGAANHIKHNPPTKFWLSCPNIVINCLMGQIWS